MIAIASTTAFHVKTTSIPSRSSQPPMTPRRLKSASRINPVATGGMTSGSDTSVSTSERPGKRRRARIHARPTPNGSTTSVAAMAHATVNQVICQRDITVAALVRSSVLGEAEAFEGASGVGAAEVVEEPLRLVSRRRRPHDGGWIDDARTAIRGDEVDDDGLQRD